MKTSAIDRIELVGRILRDRPGVTAEALAEEFGVSLRTIFRDLERLRERGYPIEGERGRGGGLHLHPNWGLPRLLLSEEEALGALLSLAISERLAFPLFADAQRRARRKLLGAFSAAERSRLAPLRDRILIGNAASSEVVASYHAPDATASVALQRAFVSRHEVRMRYTKGDASTSTRLVQPHALLINAPAWYLVAFDHRAQGARTFRLDRISQVEDTGTQFRPWGRREIDAAAGVSLAAP